MAKISFRLIPSSLYAEPKKRVIRRKSLIKAFAPTCLINLTNEQVRSSAFSRPWRFELLPHSDPVPSFLKTSLTFETSVFTVEPLVRKHWIILYKNLISNQSHPSFLQSERDFSASYKLILLFAINKRTWTKSFDNWLISPRVEKMLKSSFKPSLTKLKMLFFDKRINQNKFIPWIFWLEQQPISPILRIQYSFSRKIRI